MRLVGLGAVICVASGCGFSGSGGGDAGDSAPPGDADPCSAIEVVAGGAHTCARGPMGQVWCWGRNGQGQVGAASTGTCQGEGCVPLPTQVGGLPLAGLVGLGATHSCARTQQGVYCWGANDSGQFGNGQVGDTPTPMAVPQRAGATIITGGERHTCSLANGTVSCSGGNMYGEVGDLTTSMRATATAVSLVGVTTSGTGFNHSCGVVAGSAWCWGRNSEGQIAPGAPGGNLVGPTQVGGVADITRVVGGIGHTCAIATDATAFCWGANNAGQLGIGNNGTQNAPVAVALGPPIVSISAGGDHACAVQQGGAVSCWGSGYGLSPQPVSGIGAAATVTSGSEHDCARLVDGTVWCWGRNSYGQLGDGANPTTVSPPVKARLCGE